MRPLISKLRPRNILSFSPEFDWLELSDLNILIGPNGSGKSNLIEILNLLRSAPADIFLPIRQGGGAADWLFKGGAMNSASVEAIAYYKEDYEQLHYKFEFTASDRLAITDEFIQDAEKRDYRADDVFFYYRYNRGNPVISTFADSYLKKSVDRYSRPKRELHYEDINNSFSVLPQKVDEDYYPEITFLGKALKSVAIYRDWGFGSSHPAKSPQQTNLPSDFLLESADNLAVVLNNLKLRATDKIMRFLDALYEGAIELHLDVVSDTVQLYMREAPGNRYISARRLSDGTIRFLCLLAILLHPKPPRVICIEEPELGLHPDVVLRIPELLQDAATRAQLVVTTHSQLIVNAFGETPENVCVTEKTVEGTRIKRLDRQHLTPWLRKYSLGELWEMGEIGGNR